MERVCPIPLSDYPTITMAHGGGGTLMHQLIGKMFRTAFANPLLDQQHDGAVFASPARRLAFTTDSFVVRPLAFPGGDIGRLAVFGTVNDLAMCGARPLYLSCGFILEEGLPMDVLWRIVCSMRDAAAEARVRIVTGDTKVVDHGKGDGIYINTAGVGALEHGREINPRQIRAGDAILVSGDIGRHGMAIMAVREGLAFESTIESDCAPLFDPVHRLLEGGVEVHALRDLTRGGLAGGVIECVETARLGAELREDAIAVREDVRGACELLGLDPLYVANEGRFAAFVPADEAAHAVALLRTNPICRDAQAIGVVTESPPGQVTLRSRIGTRRMLDLPSGEQLPRIC
jgi:hydrogenase expression/formation protein HypE